MRPDRLWLCPLVLSLAALLCAGSRALACCTCGGYQCPTDTCTNCTTGQCMPSKCGGQGCSCTQPICSNVNRSPCGGGQPCSCGFYGCRPEWGARANKCPNGGANACGDHWKYCPCPWSCCMDSPRCAPCPEQLCARTLIRPCTWVMPSGKCSGGSCTCCVVAGCNGGPGVCGYCQFVGCYCCLCGAANP